MVRQLNDLGEAPSKSTIRTKLINSLLANNKHIVTTWDNLPEERQTSETLTTNCRKRIHCQCLGVRVKSIMTRDLDLLHPQVQRDPDMVTTANDEITGSLLPTVTQENGSTWQEKRHK